MLRLGIILFLDVVLVALLFVSRHFIKHVHESDDLAPQLMHLNLRLWCLTTKTTTAFLLLKLLQILISLLHFLLLLLRVIVGRVRLRTFASMLLLLLHGGRWLFANLLLDTLELSFDFRCSFNALSHVLPLLLLLARLRSSFHLLLLIVFALRHLLQLQLLPTRLCGNFLLFLHLIVRRWMFNRHYLV